MSGKNINMRKKYINLPKGYLSYTQMSLWKSNPKKYGQLYFDDRTELGSYNNSMEYGKIFADALENYKETNDLLTDAAILLLNKYDVRDKEINAEIKTKDGWIRVMGRPDTLNSKTLDFREYKTGKQPWTQAKANKHPQLFFYAMIIYLVYGIAVNDCYLDWIETENTPEGIKPTGTIKSFKVEVGLRKILETIAETIKVAKEIEVAYAMHEKRLEDQF